MHVHIYKYKYKIFNEDNLQLACYTGSHIIPYRDQEEVRTNRPSFLLPSPISVHIT